MTNFGDDLPLPEECERRRILGAASENRGPSYLLETQLCIRIPSCALRERNEQAR